EETGYDFRVGDIQWMKPTLSFHRYHFYVCVLSVSPSSLVHSNVQDTTEIVACEWLLWEDLRSKAISNTTKAIMADVEAIFLTTLAGWVPLWQSVMKRAPL